MSTVPGPLLKARSQLILSQPFFASLLLPMPMTASEEIPTFATDGDKIIYNPKWAESLSIPEMTFVLAHEVLHIVFEHLTRRGNRTPNRWNQAADYIINEVLVADRVGTMPKVGLRNSNLVKKGGGTAEGVYKLLPQDYELRVCGQSGGSMDQIFDAGSKMGTQSVDAATASAKASEIKVRVLQAANAAKMQGDLPASLERLLGDIMKAHVNWREVLRRFVSERARVDLTFARPKRRFLGEDIYLPSLTGEKMGGLTIGVDCSGSVDAKTLTMMAAEINAIREDVHPSRITVIYFDSDVLRKQVFEADEEVVLKPVGGGGTAFSPVFREINKEAEPPVACVMLTDLYCDDFGPTPSYPVLWAVVNGEEKSRVPFGEVVAVISDSD